MFANSMVIMQSLTTLSCTIINNMIDRNNGVESLYSSIEGCISDAQKNITESNYLLRPGNLQYN